MHFLKGQAPSPSCSAVLDPFCLTWSSKAPRVVILSLVVFKNTCCHFLSVQAQAQELQVPLRFLEVVRLLLAGNGEVPAPSENLVPAAAIPLMAAPADTGSEGAPARSCQSYLQAAVDPLPPAASLRLPAALQPVQATPSTLQDGLAAGMAATSSAAEPQQEASQPRVPQDLDAALAEGGLEVMHDLPGAGRGVSKCMGPCLHGSCCFVFARCTRGCRVAVTSLPLPACCPPQLEAEVARPLQQD